MVLMLLPSGRPGTRALVDHGDLAVAAGPVGQVEGREVDLSLAEGEVGDGVLFRLGRGAGRVEDEAVVAAVAGVEVEAVIAVQDVVAAIAGDVVVAVAAIDAVVATATGGSVVPVAAVDDVVAVQPLDLVVATVAVDRVIAASGLRQGQDSGGRKPS